MSTDPFGETRGAATASIDAVAENERPGFASQCAYSHPELGDYRATVRIFDNGYLTRIIVGNHGAFITTGGMIIERFREVADASRRFSRPSGSRRRRSRVPGDCCRLPRSSPPAPAPANPDRSVSVRWFQSRW